MKVKLLRKLRRRFHWFTEKDKPGWFYYDKKKNKIGYSFVVGWYHFNDMLLNELLYKIGKGYLFVKLKDRLRIKRAKKTDLQLRDRFREHFKQ